MRFFRNAHQFFILSWREQLTFLWAVFLLPCTAASVRLFGLRRSVSFLIKHSNLSPDPDTDLRQQRVESLTRLVRAAAAHGFYRANCLQQSLSLWWLLRRKGIPSNLQIGMQQEADQIKGHAWVEYEGRVLNDTPDVRHRYTAIDSYREGLFYE
jgi:hypothetical protein